MLIPFPIALWVLAAVPGFVDWLSLTDPTVKKTANWHARLNVIALLVFVASWSSGTAWR
jgi:hypothetical protein